MHYFGEKNKQEMENEKQVKAYGMWLIVKPTHTETVEQGGILVPVDGDSIKHIEAEVLAIGSGQPGFAIEDVAVGDIVVFEKGTQTDLRLYDGRHVMSVLYGNLICGL